MIRRVNSIGVEYETAKNDKGVYELFLMLLTKNVEICTNWWKNLIA